MNNNESKLASAFSEGLSMEKENVGSGLSYQGVVEWDSMSHLFLVEAIEKEFGVELPVEMVLEMDSYDKVKEILKDVFDIQF